MVPPFGACEKTVHMTRVDLFVATGGLCCSTGKAANWAEGGRLPDAAAVRQLQQVLADGHEWHPVAGSETDGFIKKDGEQSAATVYNDALAALARKGIRFLTVLGNRRGT